MRFYEQFLAVNHTTLNSSSWVLQPTMVMQHFGAGGESGRETNLKQETQNAQKRITDGFPLSLNTRVYEIEAIYRRSRVKEKVEPCSTSLKTCLRTHVKITR